MNTDIRLSTSFFSHPKTVKLIRRTGAEGVLCLQRLWIWAAQNRVDGNLSGFDDDDIEIIAGWTGTAGGLVQALSALRFFDGCTEAFSLHGWSEHQAYVTKEPERIANAKKAANARWGKESGHAPGKQDAVRPDASSNANSMPVACTEHASSNAPIQTNPNQEKDISPVSSLENEDSARAEGDAEDKFSTDASIAEPSIDFQELRQFWDEHFRPEAPLAGFQEYKQLRAAKAYPGDSRIYEDLKARIDCQCWDSGFAPGLGKYLRERTWTKPPSASPRASPVASKSWLEREDEANFNAFMAEARAKQEAKEQGEL